MLTTTYGLQLEATFRKILKAAGIRQAESDFSADALRLDAQRINPQRLARCAEFFSTRKASAPELLDKVFGIDHLIDVSGTDRVYAAIDMTANSSKVNAKELKAQRFRDMWTGLGVSQFFVVHVIGDPADLTKPGAAALIEKLWADMERAFNGPEGRVHTITLRLA